MCTLPQSKTNSQADLMHTRMYNNPTRSEIGWLQSVTLEAIPLVCLMNFGAKV